MKSYHFHFFCSSPLDIQFLAAFLKGGVDFQFL